MTRVIANMSMSLDGFIADEDDGVGELFGSRSSSSSAWLPCGSATR